MRQKVSPPKLARHWGKKPSTIIALIKCGALRAIDTRLPGAMRPRYLIDTADIAEFERARAVVRPITPPKKRRPKPSDPDFVTYF